MHGSLETIGVEVDLRGPGWERIIDPNPPVEVVARDIIFGEGPTWDAKGNQLYFTDIIFGEGPTWDAKGNQLYFTDIIGDTIWKWSPKTGQTIIRRPSVKANGTCLDLERRLVVAGWGGRTVHRLEKDGSWTTLADNWKGKKLNSPNDIVCKSDGSIWFTDPPGGLANVGMVGPDMQRQLDTQPVFRISPDGKKMTVVTEDFVYPNGLCFSPDESILYVCCSRERVIRSYDVKSNGTVGKARMFYSYSGPERGVPDGIKCDKAGNVWCTAPGGIWVHAPSGKVICRIKTEGHHPTNIAFGGDDWKTLFITNVGSVVRTRIKIAGVPSR